MGQKVSPHGLRVGVIKDWDSKWYADKANFADYLVEDNKVRDYVKKKLYVAGVSKVLIERAAENKMRVIVLTAKPGMVIGSSGAGIDNLRAELKKLTGKDIDISIEEVRRSEMDAQLTAESIAQALERRVSFRRAMKQAIGRTMKAGAKGIKVLCSGRLGGAEIARSELTARSALRSGSTTARSLTRDYRALYAKKNAKREKDVREKTAKDVTDVIAAKDATDVTAAKEAKHRSLQTRESERRRRLHRKLKNHR